MSTDKDIPSLCGAANHELAVANGTLRNMILNGDAPCLSVASKSWSHEGNALILRYMDAMAVVAAAKARADVLNNALLAHQLLMAPQVNANDLSIAFDRYLNGHTDDLWATICEIIALRLSSVGGSVTPMAGQFLTMMEMFRKYHGTNARDWNIVRSAMLVIAAMKQEDRAPDANLPDTQATSQSISSGQQFAPSAR